MKRRLPPFAFVAVLVAFLFAQLMGTVHACQVGLDVTSPVKATVAAGSALDCCDLGQSTPDAACDNHCQLSDKAPDRVQATATTSVAAMAFAIPASVLLQPNAPPATKDSPHLARRVGPAFTIRNCCFRI